MKSWTRLFFYLLLNVLVSVSATVLVLYLWDLKHDGGSSPLFRPVSKEEIQTPAPSSLPQPTAAVLPSPAPVVIVHQVGDGETFETIASEYGVDPNVLMELNGFPKDYSPSQILGAGEALQIPVTPTVGPAPVIVIDAVVAPGDIQSERVDILLKGSGSLLLEGWSLMDEDGYIFPFPSLELVSSGAKVSVYSHPGTNTDRQVFWGLEDPIWRTGETATLYDPQNKVQATYVVP